MSGGRPLVHVAAKHVHSGTMRQDGGLHARICEMEESCKCTWRSSTACSKARAQSIDPPKRLWHITHAALCARKTVSGVLFVLLK
jgi:hypothetical protein